MANTRAPARRRTGTWSWTWRRTGLLTVALLGLVPAGRRLLFLEGGYDLDALSRSTGAVLSALVDDGAYRPEAATSGGPGVDVCDAALKIRGELADGYLQSP